MPHNQSIKLTEPAVGGHAARKTKETETNNRHDRATAHVELAARCRSLAPVGYTAFTVSSLQSTGTKRESAINDANQ